METKSETIRVRTTPKLKKDAEAIFEKLGLSASDAVNLFYKQVVFARAIPFSLNIPNKETVKALKDAKARRNMKSYKNMAEFRQSLGLD